MNFFKYGKGGKKVRKRLNLKNQVKINFKLLLIKKLLKLFKFLRKFTKNIKMK